MRARPLLFAFTALLFDCATLDKLPSGTCGNKVIDTSEDCDGADVAGRHCGSPSEGAKACRLVCATDADCPSGWGCAVAGYCRMPDGFEAKANDAVSSEVTAVKVGDFDGDRRDDVLATGPRGGQNTVRTKILYFGPEAALEHTNALAAPIISPEVHDFDGDGNDDLVFGANGFAIIRGQSDRTLVPHTFPSLRVPDLDGKPVVARTTRDTSGPPNVIVVGKARDGKKNVIENAVGSISDDAMNRKLHIALPAGPDAVVGSPVWGEVFDLDPLSTCGEVVFALNAPSGSEIDVVSACRGAQFSQDGDSPAPRIVIPVPEGPLVGGVALAKLGGHTHLDILYGTAAGVFVAPGTGTRTFGSPVSIGASDFPDVPIAVADIDLDGFPDFVTPSGVVVSIPPQGGGGEGGIDGGAEAGSGLPSSLKTFKIFGVEYLTLVAARNTRWTSAAVGDFNGDVLPDIVAGSSEIPDLEFIQVHPDLSTTSSTIATNGPVLQLAGADFDGDAVEDLAIVESRPASGDDAVMYAYGRKQGPPEPPELVGRLTDITALAVSPTVPADLQVVSREVVSGTTTTALAALLGSGDRFPIAPLILVRDPTRVAAGPTRFWLPLSVHVGSFVDPSSSALFTLATGITFNDVGAPDYKGLTSAVWIAPSLGTPLEFGDAQYVADLAPTRVDLIDAETHIFEAPTVVADVDDPPDHLLDSITLGAFRGDDHPSVGIVRPKNGNGQLSAVTAVALPTDTSINVRSSLDAVDVDGDGIPDAAVVVAAGPKGSPPTSPQRAFVLLDVKGTFAQPIEVVPPPVADDSGPAALCMLTTGGASADGAVGRTRKLVVVTQHRVFLATLKTTRDGFDFEEITGLFGRNLVAGSGAATGDFDGDGVEDLAVADAGSLRILRQKGRLP
jgi:hypothetical protein